MIPVLTEEEKKEEAPSVPVQKREAPVQSSETAVQQQAPAPQAPTPPSTSPSTPPPPPPSVPVPVPSAPPVTINVGEEAAQPLAATWPNRLKVNSYTLGSPLVPEFAPTGQFPVHVVREAQEQFHASAYRQPPARVQPETGPALWIIALLALCSLPLFVEKRGEE